MRYRNRHNSLYNIQPQALRHIHQSGDVCLHLLGEIKIRRLYLAVRYNLLNCIHHILVDEHAQKSPSAAQENPRQQVTRIVRPKGVSFRSTPPRVSDGKHEAIISEELWQRSQAVRTSRWVTVKSAKKTVRGNLLQGLVVCSHCGRRLNIQTPKNCATYYRENSHHRRYHDCPYIGQSVRAVTIDAQVAELIRSIHLLENWEPIARQMLHEQRDQFYPEAERKEIRGMLQLMSENYERGQYESEECQYWQKVSTMKEKLSLLERVPEPAINRAAQTLLDLRETWENATQEERGDLVNVLIQEVSIDMADKCILWVKARPDYEPMFSIQDGLRLDNKRRYWIERKETERNISDIQVDVE
jgi:hypothetical protein